MDGLDPGRLAPDRVVGLPAAGRATLLLFAEHDGPTRGELGRRDAERFDAARRDILADAWPGDRSEYESLQRGGVEQSEETVRPASLAQLAAHASHVEEATRQGDQVPQGELEDLIGVEASPYVHEARSTLSLVACRGRHEGRMDGTDGSPADDVESGVDVPPARQIVQDEAEDAGLVGAPGPSAGEDDGGIGGSRSPFCLPSLVG